MTRDELLVGSDYRFSGLQSGADDMFSRIQAADQFDHDVDVRAEYDLNIVGPDDVIGHPGLLLFFNVTVADAGEAEGLVRTLAEDLGDGATDGSEADKGYAGITA